MSEEEKGYKLDLDKVKNNISIERVYWDTKRGLRIYYRIGPYASWGQVVSPRSQLAFIELVKSLIEDCTEDFLASIATLVGENG